MISHKELIKYCNASYSRNVEAFENELLINGKTKFYYGDSLHKYTIEHDDCYVIVFRGSENRFDWLNDFTFNAVDFNHTNIHQGFLTALDAELNPRLQYDKPVFITGHSFGGALALLEADRLAECDVNIKEVVTFGSPMVGALSFKEKFEYKLGDKTTRYVNGDDIVPFLPPLRYFQVGKCTIIGSKSSWLNPLKYYRMIRSHHIEQYVTEMEKLSC